MNNKGNRGFAPILIIIAVVLVGGATYALVPRTVLKDFFEKGDKPTEGQFGDTIDSTLEKGDTPKQDDFADPIDSGLNLEIKPKVEPVACTMEAKICPDGSAVGRQGPNCEFAACPAKPSGDISGDMQFTGTVVTGASQGEVKQHCANGLYLAQDPGLQMNARQTLLLLKGAEGQMLTDQQYVGQRVTITGTYPDENKLRCEALICGCEEYLIVETIALAS